MELRVIATGSEGNGYLFIANSGETLIIEAGCHVDKVITELDYCLDNVVGCLVSHRHGDHAGHVRSYIKHGIDCYVNQDTIKHYGLSGHHCFEIQDSVQIKIGNFKIKPLAVEHSAPCLAFLIDHPESGRTFFLTDSSYCKWNLSKAKVNNWLVECNYDKEKMLARRDAREIPGNVYEHVVTGHFSLDNCLEFFKANDLSETVRIITLHLSAGNGDPKKFKSKIQRQTGKEVIVAKAGLVIYNFGKKPF